MSALPNVSDLFDPASWREVTAADGFNHHLTDVTYHRGISLPQAAPAEDQTAQRQHDPVGAWSHETDGKRPGLQMQQNLAKASSMGTEAEMSGGQVPGRKSLAGAWSKEAGRGAQMVGSKTPTESRSKQTGAEVSGGQESVSNNSAESRSKQAEPQNTDMPWVRIAIDRPEIRNAFRPKTVDDLLECLNHARQSADVGAIILTGNGPSPKDGGWAFCSGGDQRIRGADGYRYEDSSSGPHASTDQRRAHLDRARAGRLHILEVQRLVRQMPKPVIAAIPGWAAGGGHSLNVVCDLSIASLEQAQFKQVDANVGSFDAGYGSALLARQVGDKRARQIFFLAQTYDAQTAERWGVVNAAVPHKELEKTAIQWCRIITSKSPQAIRMLKYAFNLPDEGILGQQLFAGEATRLAYMTAEAQEGRDAFLERRAPDWSAYPYYY